ncbi:MAG: hypothetical protein Q9M14_06735 [Mariprofundaceae bacterium]|nr:hypothetical protein [Mariprofundaceae bacterium]
MGDSTEEYHKQCYLWVSLALTIPVFLWPAFLLFGFTPAFGISIEENWLISACCLLMAVVVADSILSYRHHISHAIGSAIWIIVASSIIPLTIRNPDMIWFIAALFALRSLYVFQSLWHHSKPEPQQWWRWTAWWRDSSTALVMFLWLNYWPQ